MLLVCLAFAVVDGDDCYTCGEYDYGHDGDSVADDEDDSADADSVGISCSKTVVWCFCVLRFCVFAFLRLRVASGWFYVRLLFACVLVCIQCVCVSAFGDVRISPSRCLFSCSENMNK